MKWSRKKKIYVFSIIGSVLFLAFVFPALIPAYDSGNPFGPFMRKLGDVVFFGGHIISGVTENRIIQGIMVLLCLPIYGFALGAILNFLFKAKRND